MKRTLLSLLTFVSAMVASAQTAEPNVTFKAEMDGNERELELSLDVAGSAQIDWGDGNLVTISDIPAFDGWNAVKAQGVVKGDGVVKVYAPDLVYFDCVSRVDGAQLTSLDVTKAPKLQQLYANANKLASIDLTACPDLQTVDVQNNQLTSIDVSKNTNLTKLTLTNNLLTSIDIQNCQKLATLYLSNNKFAGHLDLSTNPNLKSVYALDNEISSVDLGENVASKPYFSFNNNKLTSFDVTRVKDAANGTFFLIGNLLTEIKLPEGVTVKTVNISKNNFTLATLPQSGVKTLTYAPQSDLAIAESYEVGSTLDLSSQTSDKLNTTFAVLTADGKALTEGTDYTIENGKITFLKAQEQAVYVTMSSALFSKLTGSNIFKTTQTKVVAATGISGTNADEAAQVSVAGQSIILNGLQNGDAVKVITIGGMVVDNFTATSSQAVVKAGKGLHIVKINKKTVKVSL